MPTYVLLTKLSSDAIIDPQEMADLHNMVQNRVMAECSDVAWEHSYVLLGRYDALDIFSAPNNETASKVAVVIRSFGHSTTEILPATHWDIFRKMVGEIGGDHPEQGKESSTPSPAPALVVDRQESIEDEVDEAMVESFPASDPPSYSAR